ncbi:MAG: glycerol kinase GlpK [Deltaproteobacteria bacterium]|nr:glycerol kinase GlpK [Deltaproteobacteria bacterium]
MSDAIILAIDQGTTGTTVLAVDENLQVLSRGYQEFKQIYPQPGWVEHKGEDIWATVESATRACLSSLKNENGSLAQSRIKGIGITNQRETTCLFDDESKPLANFIVWQCKRTQNICEQLKGEGHEALFKKKTGLVLDPYFSGTKLQWLLDSDEKLRAGAENGSVKFGTIDSWLLHRLTGGKVHKTDVTNASRTLMMDLKTCEWDDELLSLLNVPKTCLPEITSSSEVYGATLGLSFLDDGIPIAGIAGDQQAALFGQGCFTPGEAKCTFGTGCFLLFNTGCEIVYSKHGLLTTVAVKLGDEVHYALEGAAFIGGAAVQWVRDMLQFVDEAPKIEDLAETVDSSGDVVFVPALAGLGAPHWRPEARGVLAGFSRDTTQGHIARAVLEGIATQNRDILDAMAKEAGVLSSLKVDGGASANNLLMQFQADILDVECVRPTVVETTALGAAALAGLAVGVFSSRQAVLDAWKEDRRFKPSMSEEDRNRHLEKWDDAVRFA